MASLAVIIVQILSALYDNDLTTAYLLVNAFKSRSDTVGEGVMNDQLEQVNAIKECVNLYVKNQFYKDVIIQSINSAFEFDGVACIVNIARSLVKHAENVLEVIQEMKMYDVCVSGRETKRYRKHLSDLCSQKHLIITDAGLQSLEEDGQLRTNHLVSINGYVTNCGITRMLTLCMCNGAL